MRMSTIMAGGLVFLLGSAALEATASADMCGGGGGDDVVEPDAADDAGNDAGPDAQAAAKKRRTRQIAGGLGLIAGLGAVWLVARSRGGGAA